MKDTTSNQQPTERFSAVDIVAGAKDGRFKHGDTFKMNNGSTDYDCRLTIEPNGTVNLTEIDLKLPIRPDNPNKHWWRVTGGSV